MTTLSIDTLFNSKLVSSVYGSLKSKYLKFWNNYISNPPSDSITEVWPRVYISNLQAALSYDILSTLGITHVVTAVVGVDMEFQDSIEYLYIPLMDNVWQDISSEFKKSNAFIREALEDPLSRVLIHCMVGASRSATLAAAWIMEDAGYSSDKAIEIMRSRRPIINPNAYFREQLASVSFQ